MNQARWQVVSQPRFVEMRRVQQLQRERVWELERHLRRFRHGALGPGMYPKLMRALREAKSDLRSLADEYEDQVAEALGLRETIDAMRKALRG